MSDLYKVAILFLVIFFAKPVQSNAQATSKYKCMIQMTNYMGEGAYIVISLINSKGAYEKTLYVMGADKKWYKTIKEWNKFYLKQPNVSAVTGASITGGDRGINVIEIDKSKINAGYKLRFESAVEDKAYNVKDLEVPLTTETLAGKSDGTGYIRYVRFSPN
ncbi:MAG: DUF2271 domain-containing protein [Bacteroidota bacterium]